MKFRLFLATLCMLVFPTWFSSSPTNRTATTQPFGAVAFAGHTHAGGWCGCGSEGCICDRGENMNAPVNGETEHFAPAGTGDPGPALLMLALAFFLWTRLRA